MRILGFDTATRATTVALCDFDASRAEPGGPLSCVLELEARDDPHVGERPRHATRLMRSIVELLDRADSKWEEVDRIAVGVGPGSFTGLRIGIATARALGRARAIELVGVSTLQSLALGAQLQSLALGAQRHPPTVRPDGILAVLDARRGEVFTAAWRVGESGGKNACTPPQQMQPLLAPRALSPETLAELIPELGTRVLAVGDGAVEFRLILGCSGAQIPEDDSELHRVTAISHCRLACNLRASAPDEIFPEYLRLPDAEIARRAAGRK